MAGLCRKMADGSDKCGDSEHVSDSSTGSETSRPSLFSPNASNKYSKPAKGGRNGNMLKIGAILPTHVTRLKRKCARRIRLQNAR